jgi:hypothetical protein
MISPEISTAGAVEELEKEVESDNVNVRFRGASWTSRHLSPLQQPTTSQVPGIPFAGILASAQHLKFETQMQYSLGGAVKICVLARTRAMARMRGFGNILDAMVMLSGWDGL